MKVIVTGDFFPGLRLKKEITQPPQELLGDFHGVLSEADLAVVNLEAPLTSSIQPIAKTGPALKGEAKAATFLKEACFGLATLANNHILDYGATGLKDTLQVLREHEIYSIGAGLSVTEAMIPYVFRKDQRKLAILNFAENEWSTTHENHPGANPIDAVSNFVAIQNAKKTADHVLVITHGGHEMYQLPSPRMKSLFRFYITAGADVVVNHHPHCVSGHEKYAGGLIFYSIGNFLFDHISHREGIWNKGVAIELIWSDDNVLKFQLLHFDQSGNQKIFSLCDQKENEQRNKELSSLNKIIEDDALLKKHFAKWANSRAKQYWAFIEPHHNRYVQALQNRKLLPSLWSERKKLYLLNLIRCEAHHDILKFLLEDEVSNTQ